MDLLTAEEQLKGNAERAVIIVTEQERLDLNSFSENLSFAKILIVTDNLQMISFQNDIIAIHVLYGGTENIMRDQKNFVRGTRNNV